jgi:hypothetical protein
MKDRLTAIEEELMNTKAVGRLLYPPPNVPTRLSQKLVGLGSYVGSADRAPRRQAYEVFDELSQKINAQLQAFEEIVDRDIPALNDDIRRLNVPAILPKRAKEAVSEGA